VPFLEFAGLHGRLVRLISGCEGRTRRVTFLKDELIRMRNLVVQPIVLPGRRKRRSDYRSMQVPYAGVADHSVIAPPGPGHSVRLESVARIAATMRERGVRQRTGWRPGLVAAVPAA
jgi:hypothetical protein